MLRRANRQTLRLLWATAHGLAPYMTFDTLDSSIHIDASANTVFWDAPEAFKH